MNTSVSVSHMATAALVPLLGVLAPLCSLAAPLQAQAGTAYPKLTNTVRSFTNLNVEAVRGFAVTADGSALYALNVNESTIVKFANLAGPPVARWRTLNHPVSIVIDGDTLLVVGQGSHALARHDSTSGALLDVVQLKSEPADIVVDTETDTAWVSCMGSDCVQEISLGTNFGTPVTWGVGQGLFVKRPRFLFLEGGSPTDPTDNTIFVAPLVSGNNTMISTTIAAPLKETLLDGYDTSRFPAPHGLPDLDLYRIRPGATPSVHGIVRRAGSILLAHGRNPSSNAYWMLSIDENNLLANSEPAIRGLFVQNQLAITPGTSLPAWGAAAVFPNKPIDLDDNTPSTPTPTYSASTSVSFPYALDFDASGWAVIGAATSPIAVMVDVNGSRTNDFLLTNGSGIDGLVLRTVKILPSQSKVIGYCQQTNNLLLWTYSPFQAAPTAELSLGNDPTPEPVQRGRAIWYDGTRSLDGRTSCNTCHPQGGADSLVWQISNSPVDEKGPMVTQPLLGIEDSFPYHWRGERELSDFNDAFPGLLGTAAELDAGELADFLEFCFSLRPAANPNQDFDRRLKTTLTPNALDPGDGTTPEVGDPRQGANEYLNVSQDGLFGNGSCVSCHGLPTGSNGDFFADRSDLKVATKAIFEIIQLNTHFPLKDQNLVDVTYSVPPPGSGTSTFKSQSLGSGILHDGRSLNLVRFVKDFFSLSNQRASHIASFLNLFDDGTAPAVHQVVHLGATSPSSAATTISGQMLPQTNSGWIGVVVLGRHLINGVRTPVAWYWDPATSLFVPEDTAVIGTKNWTQMSGDASGGVADLFFLGVPPGNERRLGGDADNDGLSTGQEIVAGTDRWNPDTDGDGWLDGHEVSSTDNPLVANTLSSDSTPPTLSGSLVVDFVNASQVKLRFQSSEPAKWSITLQAPNGAVHTDSRLSYDTTHTAVVHKLEPSTIDPINQMTNYPNVFSGTLTLTDLNGVPSSPPISLSNITTGTMVHFTPTGQHKLMVVGDITMPVQTHSGTNFTGRVDLRVDFREESPPWTPAPDMLVIGQLLRQKANGMDWDIITAASGDITSSDAPNYPGMSFSVAGTPYADLPGPFLILPATDSAGVASLNFTLSNVGSTQKVMFNVLTIHFNDPGLNPANPDFAFFKQDKFQPNATSKLKRNVIGG